VTWLAGIAGHEVGDYLIQLDCDAQAKQHQTRAGRFALARHAITYAATQAAMKWIAYRATGVRVSGRALLAGTVVEGLLHAVIDDGRLLRRLADVTGKRAFHDLADHGVNGRMLMDQAVHKGVQIPVGAVVTVMVAGGAR
jgi:hypothetical protein